MKNLALLGSLTPPANNYVVWLAPYNEHRTPMKQGAIGVDGKLNGELKTGTSSKNFNVLVTGEQCDGVTKPSDRIVLRGHVAD